MSRRPPRLSSLKFRIALAFVVAGLAVSGFVAGSTYILARSYLTRQRLAIGVGQSLNTLRFVLERLDRQAEAPPAEELATLLHTRAGTDVLLVSGERSVASSVSVTHETIPADLARVVEDGGVAYTLFGEKPRRFAFGTPLPRTPWTVYFVWRLQELDATLRLLGRILGGVTAVAAAVAAVLGFRLAGRVVEPLRRAGEASQRVAEGLIDTRLDERSGDELGMLATSFNEMARALQERIARERRFVADASHELRTPLTALMASTDYLAEHGRELPEDLRATADLAAREARALQRLVDELLELSRMEAGTVEVRPGEVDLGDFAREVVRRRAEGRPVQLALPEEGLVVRTDKQRLERVVGNLLENALVHGQGRDVEIRVERRGGRPTICVSDRGPGIPQTDLPRIFDPFWRGDQARRRGPGGGSGLGLAIARENAHLIGAELQVRSPERGGTRAEVRLPPGPPGEGGG